MVAEVETFWTLLHDTAHWEFEIFLMILFDGLIGYVGFKLLWPRIKAHFHEDLQHAGHDHPPDEHEEHGTELR